MDRRILCVGLAVLGSSFMLLTGVASARVSPTVAPGTCEVHSLESFVNQGEFESEGTVGDVIEISCDPYTYSQGATVTVTASQLFDRCGKDVTWYIPGEEGGLDDHNYPQRSIVLKLDGDGNANVGLIAGPHCMPGGSLITVDENEAPYETYITEFKVLPSKPTPEGLYITPEKQVEDAETSSVVTIAQTEFTGVPEKYVRIGADQLYNRCAKPYSDKLEFVRENRTENDEESGSGPGEFLRAIQLDNDGNGFVLLLGETSCAEGPSKIEADLEEPPTYKTLEPQDFTIEAPRPR